MNLENNKIYKNAKGVTLVALSITIIVLIIITGIGIYSGKDVIDATKLESLRTNMLLIQAKSKEYVEQATFEMGIDPDSSKKESVRDKVYSTDAKLEKAENDIPSEFGISDTSSCYWLTKEAQSQWGLEDIKLEKEEKYLIKFDEENEEVEVYNTLGFDGKYSLTDINQIKIDE